MFRPDHRPSWLIKLSNISHLPIPVAARSKAWFGLLPLALWDYGFKSSHGHGSLFPVSVVCCQVEGCGAGRSGGILASVVCLSDPETSDMRRPGSIRVSNHRKVKCLSSSGIILYCFISTSWWPQPFTSSHASLIIISSSHRWRRNRLKYGTPV